VLALFLGEGAAPFLLGQLGPGFSHVPGSFLVVGTIRTLVRFGRQKRQRENAYAGSRTPSRQILETTIGDLRKTYGADFAKGCADDEKIPDVLRKRPWLRNVIREHEARRFEEI
jgi:hypothetical protein